MKICTHLCKQFMRISFLLFTIVVTVGLVSVRATELRAQSLSTRISINFNNENLASAIKKLEQKASLVFAYDEEYLGLSRKNVNQVSFTNESVETILVSLLRNSGLSFKDQAGNILLFKQIPGKVTGKVTDENGEVLPGASVRALETTLGTVTNADGTFSLNIPEGVYTIEVTFVGYQKSTTKNVKVSGGKSAVLNVSLVGGNQLKEVTVSYGKQRQVEVTGSIAQVSAAPLQDMPVMQFGQQLQGKVAGVNVAETSGQPGRGIAFRIRGAASLATGYQPLFVIDGMPITGSINNINPDEIESFTVLKDASASALYGSRAANGVVLITTKHAKPGTGTSVTFNANYGVQKLPMNKVPKPMNAEQFATFMNERYQDQVKYEGVDPTKKPIDPVYANPSQYGEGTNWFKLLTQTAPIQSYDVTVQSAHEKSSSTAILSYESQEGVLINTGTKLFSLRLNQDFSMGSKNQVKIGFNLAPSYRMDHNNRLNTEGVNGLYERIFESSPLISPYNPDGSYTLYVNSPGMVNYINPLAQFMLNRDDYQTTRILGNTYANYTFLPGFALKTNVGIDKGAESRTQFTPASITTNNTATGISSSIDNYSWTAEATLNYEKTFHRDHHLEALVGYSAQKFNQLGNSISATGFTSDAIPYLSQATTISGGSSNTQQYSLLSTIGRLNYNYKEKYLLQGAIRNDGSSRFGEDRKYGYFPSVSAGWVVTGEDFMDRFKAVNLLKIRASYGITGNNDIGNYTAIPVLGNVNYVFSGAPIIGTTVTSLGNTELAWERNKQLDIGLDLSILHDRISFTYDYYNKISDGLIQARPIPRASGFATINYNVGKFAFWGHEFTINTVNTTGKLKWNTGFNVSFDRNLIKSLVSPGFLRRNNTVSSDYYRLQVGHHLGEFYGFVYQGLYKDAADLASSPKYKSGAQFSDVGTIKVKDLNGDGIIDDVNDRTFIGDPTPKFSGGLTNNFAYKNFDLNIHLSFSVGGHILNAAKWAYQTNMDGSRVPLAAALDHWRSVDNPGSGAYPRTETNTTGIGREVNSQWVENGSYLTAKNISLGYTFNFKNNLMLKHLRIYTSIQQAFVLTKYSGMNPEIGLSGLDATSGIGVDEEGYPIPRTFSFGLSTTFR